MIRLNIGCGPDWRRDYVNVDCEPESTLRQWAQASGRPEPLPGTEYECRDLRLPWPWADDSVSEILADNMLEHFEHAELEHLLAEATRVLRSGGRIHGRVPDFARIYALCQVRDAYQWDPLLVSGLYPEPWMNALSNFAHGWGHKQIFTQEMLQARLARHGLRAEVSPVETHALLFVATKE